MQDFFHQQYEYVSIVDCTNQHLKHQQQKEVIYTPGKLT